MHNWQCILSSSNFQYLCGLGAAFIYIFNDNVQYANICHPLKMNVIKVDSNLSIHFNVFPDCK